MQIESILSPQAVIANSKACNKKRLFKELAQLGQELFGVDCEMLQTSLQDREDLGPTAMGSGIAIPHARIDGFESVKGIFIKLEEPIDFDANDRIPVDLVFALFAPVQSGADHLKALARVSRLLRSSDLRDSLRSARDSEAIFAILVENVGSVAA